jgi:hypothetical protein
VNDAPDFKKHDDPRYERPNCGWRCGRAAAWNQPCPNGPGADGKCGAGPEQPPCVPRPTLRALRGRLAWFVAAVVILLLSIGFHFGAKRPGRASPLSADSGPLSAVHASFTERQGCAACHTSHEEGLSGLVRAAFAPHDMTGKCIECHTFGGKERLAHNAAFASRIDLSRTECTMCHTEHRGQSASLISMKEAQCHHCHRTKFENFTGGHPPFPTNFPHFVRSGIQFNHTKHMGDYFSQAGYRERAPAQCLECHLASRDERQARTAGFDQACARCHAQDIRENFLMLMALPEPATNTQVPISAESSTRLMKVLLGSTNDSQAYSAGLRELIQGMTNSTDALARLLDKHSMKPASSNLLAGLNREVLARPALLWWRGEKLDAESSLSGTGWSWVLNDDFLPELRYVALGHADPVVKSWIQFGLGLTQQATNTEQRQFAIGFRDSLADPTNGAGRCVKCHSMSEKVLGARAIREIAWHHRGSELRPHTVFSHGKHLGVANCLSCHVLNFKADFTTQFKGFDPTTAVSSFKPISMVSCTPCHAEGKVRSDCFLCHRYHESPGLRRTVLTAR